MRIDSVGKKCAGCMACQNACHMGAIKQISGDDGFLYPEIIVDRCINCGLCARACPILNDEVRQDRRKAFYGRTVDEAVVRKSSSGGAFTVLAEKVLERGGIVFGAVFEKETKSVLYKSSDEVSLDDLRRSKYVESRVGDSFQKAKAELEKGRDVLFVGTPCHITGLKLFLNKDYPNLLTADFICGGAASPVYFREYLGTLEAKYNAAVKEVNFRPKLYGWKEHSIKIDFENEKTYTNYAYLDTYFRGFVFEGVIKRETCFSCQFRENHGADIILADFWGYKALGIETDNKGLSLLVANSEKGEAVLNRLTEKEMDLTEIPLSYTDYGFAPYKNPATKKEKKKQFLKAYEKLGFEKAAKKTYMKKCVQFKAKKIIKGLLK